MKVKNIIQKIAAFGCTLLFAAAALTNSAAAQETINNDKLTAEIDKAVHALYDSFVQRDAAAFGNLVTDGGFLYDSYGYLSATDFKKEMSGYFQTPQAAKSKLSYEIKKLKVVAVNADAAIANFEMIRRTENDKGEKREYREQVSEVFVKRDGSWQVFAEHVSKLPKSVEAVSAGMPLGWRITPLGENVANYKLTVDTAVKHGGKASANIKGTCAANETDWVSLAQSIAADDFRGRRVRLTGWLKTENTNKAGIWMRVDGNRKQFGFDNMDDRAVTGTTDWKQYSVVLDVPADAVNIYFGTLVQGAGNVWADDFKIETVGNDAASTNKMTAEEMKRECSRCEESKPDTNKKAVNLDFEAGAVN